jgi:GDP-D-mannose dehydratase
VGIGLRFLIGDSGRRRSELGWKPAWEFKALIMDMVRYDVWLLTRRG